MMIKREDNSNNRQQKINGIFKSVNEDKNRVISYILKKMLK